MSTVKIPPVLRASVGGVKEVDASGASVGDVLRSLAQQHPATESQLFSEDGELNRYVNVYLNDEDVRVLDGLDNFPTRYLLNDASVRLQTPVVSASILGFEGQLSVFHPYEGPCYRCLYPTPPPAELAPSCGAAGVLGVLPGVMGLLQSVEVIKLVTGAGDTMAGRLLLYDALGTTFTELKVRRDPDCPICSRDPGSISDEEMGVFPD